VSLSTRPRANRRLARLRSCTQTQTADLKDQDQAWRCSVCNWWGWPVRDARRHEPAPSFRLLLEQGFDLVDRQRDVMDVAHSAVAIEFEKHGVLGPYCALGVDDDQPLRISAIQSPNLVIPYHGADQTKLKRGFGRRARRRVDIQYSI